MIDRRHPGSRGQLHPLLCLLALLALVHAAQARLKPATPPQPKHAGPAPPSQDIGHQDWTGLERQGSTGGAGRQTDRERLGLPAVQVSGTEEEEEEEDMDEERRDSRGEVLVPERAWFVVTRRGRDAHAGALAEAKMCAALGQAKERYTGGTWHILALPACADSSEAKEAETDRTAESNGAAEAISCAAMRELADYFALQGDTRLLANDGLVRAPSFEGGGTARPGAGDRELRDPVHTTWSRLRPPRTAHVPRGLARVQGQASSTEEPPLPTPGLVAPPGLSCRTNVDAEGRRGYAAGAFSWAVDRLDGGVDGTFCTPEETDGAGTAVYVLDGGVAPHPAFAHPVRYGFDYYDEEGLAGRDCNGHGTHVAALAASRTYGVAPGAHVHSVRVLACDGVGSFSAVAAGLLYVEAQQEAQQGHEGGAAAVVNLSLGAQDFYSAGIAQLIADLRAQLGVLSVASAGNGGGAPACDHFPSSAPAAISVAASQEGDRLAAFSNVGSCVTLTAPGANVVSASLDGGARLLSGTSMAAPLVSGHLLLILARQGTSAHQGATAEAAEEAYEALLCQARAALQPGGTGTPNLLLQVGPAARDACTRPPPPAPQGPPPPPPPPPDGHAAQPAAAMPAVAVALAVLLYSLFA